MGDYIEKLNQMRPFSGVWFICATHPHGDHICGINALMKDSLTMPEFFWDSGFRHKSSTYINILKTVRDNQIDMIRVSSGMEWYYGKVRISALAPSVLLRIRYATYGVDMNNASVVLRFEYCDENAVTVQSQRYEGTVDPDIERELKNPVAVLAGDAEFDSWGRVTEEFPYLEKADKNKPLVKKMLNLLKCDFLKVSHHGSMHSAPLEVYERMKPALAVISNEQSQSGQTPEGTPRFMFPHRLTSASVSEVKTKMLTTDGSYERELGLAQYAHQGTVIAAMRPGKKLRYTKLDDVWHEDYAVGGLKMLATPPDQI